ncbi:MAG TPA: hypothetical protein PKL15_16495 [Saprospiraceae bacterium]|nr:hypothetical protein [Saprospiraceae bacterium]
MIRFIPVLFAFLLACQVHAQFASLVADQTFKVDGTHEFPYAFAAGDQVALQVQLLTGRRLKVVELIQWPDNAVFRSYELDTLISKTIVIPQTGVYLLRIQETGMGKKVCRFTILRAPGSPETAHLDTRVNWDLKQYPQYQIATRHIPAGKKTEVVSLGGQVTVGANNFGTQKGMNAYQFTLPANTVRWAFRISVGQAGIEARRKDAEKLTSTLKSGAVRMLGVEPETALAAFALGMAVDLTVSSAGEDVDYALLSPDNLPKFYAGESYDAFMFQSGVSVDAQRRSSPLEGTWLFALRSDNWMRAIDVNIDIEAVTETLLYNEEMYLEPVKP